MFKKEKKQKKPFKSYSRLFGGKPGDVFRIKRICLALKGSKQDCYKYHLSKYLTFGTHDMYFTCITFMAEFDTRV